MAMSNDQSYEPEIVILYCQRCIPEDAGIEAVADHAAGLSAQPVMMPCSSKIEVSYILKVLERGADGVEVVVCPPDACQFLVGSRRKAHRIDYIRGLLDEIHVGAERVGLTQGPIGSAQDLLTLAAGRARAIESLGPNPIKLGAAKGDVQ
jgi:coenzyme F420-reducing hydrogenase delta subunit